MAGAGLRTDKVMEGWLGQIPFVEHQLWWKGLLVGNRRIGLFRKLHESSVCVSPPRMMSWFML